MRYRDRAQELKDAILRVEESGDDFLIDQTAWVLGFFKDTLPVKEWLKDCPQMLLLLPEMKAEPNAYKRMLRIADWIDRDDDLGFIAESLRKGFY